MKNSRIIEAWDSVNPDSAARERMLAAIMDKDRRESGAGKFAAKKYPRPSLVRGITAAAAACVVIAVGCAVYFRGGYAGVETDYDAAYLASPQGGAEGTTPVNDDGGANRVQQWDAAFTAARYFANCTGGSEGTAGVSSSDALAAPPWAETRSFSDMRAELEAEGKIPVLDSHPIFSAAGNYNADGSLYSLELTWSRRDAKGTENYSDLRVTAGYDEVPAIEDCIAVRVDADGNVLEDSVTVTRRDGVDIIARGGGFGDKSITFKNGSGWYRISGSWNDSFEDVAGLFELIWAHPLDFSLFSMEAGDEYTSADIKDYADAFAGYLPDFAAFGLTRGENWLTLKNGVPVDFEGHYYASEEDALNSSGEVVHWCVDTQPEGYELEGSLGELGGLTEERVLALSPPDAATVQTKIIFTQGEVAVTVYTADLPLAWRLIQSLRP